MPTHLLRPLGWSLLVALLLLPLLAMQVSEEVAWTGFDFAFAAVMLGALGLGMEAISRLSRPLRTRLVLSALALAGFVLVWGALATA